MNARRRGGFTLIELVVVIALLSLALLFAVPGFLQYRRNADLAEAVSNLILAAGNAKSAALKSGRNAFVQANDTATGWRSGWFVFVDTNWNNQYDPDTDQLVMSHAALSADLSATPSAGSTLEAGYLMFNGGGFPRNKGSGTPSGTVTLGTQGRSVNVVVDNSGRLKSCTVGTSGCSAL